MKELPTGLQVFEHIRSSDAVYVDKTDMIYKMVSGARMQFFLARPRRFGKTLMCWTLDALFSGKRDLFDGLAVSKSDWAWGSYPVIHLDMSRVRTAGGMDGVSESLAVQTREVADKHGITVERGMAPGDMLGRVIVGAAGKHGKPVVVIVDEYDKPFLDFYNQSAVAAEVRNVMRDYYIQLKANESNMRFLFMTGISKFTKAGVFSVLNNLNDLSMDKDFGTMLGYTGEELTGYFGEHLAFRAKEMSVSADELVGKMKHYYNGYSFDGVHRVYCPFSVLNFFQSGEFGNFWMESASPSIIADYMKGRNLTVEQFSGMTVDWDFVRNPGEIETSPPHSFLYQAGYLTIRERIDDDFILDYPNTEVLNSMSKLTAQNIVEGSGEDFMDFRASLMDALADGDAELFVETLNRLLASIPYDDYVNAAKQGRRISKNKLTAQEWLYRSTILAFFRGCGVLTFGEMHGNLGRSDIILTRRGVTWIIEIKVAANGDCETQAKDGMEQIRGNQYAAPYKNVKKIAIAIDDKTRQIGKWITGKDNV